MYRNFNVSTARRCDYNVNVVADIGRLQLSIPSDKKMKKICGGRIISINKSVKKGTAKMPVEKAVLCRATGIKGDAHAKKGSLRQVSALDYSSVKKLKKKDKKNVVRCGAFGENLDLSGINIKKIGVGCIMKFESGAELELTKIGKECRTPCIIKKTCGRCIMPVEGIFCVVIKSGRITVGEKYSLFKRTDEHL